MMRNCFLVLGLLAATTTAARADDEDGNLYACKVRTGQLSVTFKPQTDIKDLATWVMGFTCKNVILDAEAEARVPRVTIMAPNKMNTKQALQLFVDAVEATGLKVVQKNNTIIIKLGPDMPRSCPTVASTSRSSGGDVLVAPPTPEAPAAPDPEDEELAKLMDAGIKKTDDTHVTVTAALVDKLLANPMAMAKGARVVPAIKNGKPDGFKLYAIRPNSIYARVGFANGDTIHKVNGFELTSADKALEVYTKLREAKSLTIDITRRGKPVTLVITIK